MAATTAVTPSVEQRVAEICQAVGNDRTRLLDVLLELQRTLRGIEPAVMEAVARQLDITRIEVEGMVSFYAFLSDHPTGEVVIRVCDDIIDRHAGAIAVAEAFADELGTKIGTTSSDGRFTLGYTPCIGMSDQAPAALLNDTLVTCLSPESARAIATQLQQGTKPTDLGFELGDGNNAHPLVGSMVNNNVRQVGEVLLGEVPEYAGLAAALQLQPVDIIQTLGQSGLRGRGGAGFPTARKWQLALDAPAERRVVICNADEGEPGTFKDRVLMTERAELMVEGMVIAAHVIGSDTGILYLRGEYAYLRSYLESVLDDCRSRNLLGTAIQGRAGFDFDIRIQMGAGAYICGEESSLISSCEGLRGEPKNRPPFPAESGYLGHPTIVDNVETYCDVARILDRGGDWFAAIGTPRSTGTKLFSVSGDCERPGVYELPFGITVRDLLERAGASDPAAVQVGGPSGEMINMSQFDRQLSFEDLPTGGSVMIFSNRRNVLEIVDYFMEFFVEESCGYCTPCRVGNVFLKRHVESIRKGLCQLSDLEYLQELGKTISLTSRCGLGMTSPNPVLSTIRNFPLVYTALLKEHEDGMQASFDIQHALEESRRLAKRRSMIYDPTYQEG